MGTVRRKETQLTHIPNNRYLNTMMSMKMMIVCAIILVSTAFALPGTLQGEDRGHNQNLNLEQVKNSRRERIVDPRHSRKRIADAGITVNRHVHSCHVSIRRERIADPQHSRKRIADAGITVNRHVTVTVCRFVNVKMENGAACPCFLEESTTAPCHEASPLWV